MLSHRNFKLNKWHALGKIFCFNILLYIDINIDDNKIQEYYNSFDKKGRYYRKLHVFNYFLFNKFSLIKLLLVQKTYHKSPIFLIEKLHDQTGLHLVHF